MFKEEDVDLGAIIVLALGAIAVFVMFNKSRTKTVDYTSAEYDITPAKQEADLLSNPDKKPSEFELEFKLGPKKYKSYCLLKENMAKLGTPELLWRGQENGWVLSLKEGNGIFGFVVLVEEHLVGHLTLSRLRYNGIITDTRLPESLRSYIGIQTVFDGIDPLAHQRVSDIFFDGDLYQVRIPLENEEKCQGFIVLIELNKELYQFDRKV